MAQKASKKAKTGRKTDKHDKHGRKLPVRVYNDPPMRRFIENVPETEFTAALEAAPEPKIAAFLAARADPTYRDESFASLCRKFNISLQEIDDIWRNHQLHTGMVRMMTHVPQVLDDVGEDAKSKWVSCDRCDGLKVLIDDKTHVERDCPVCNGHGRLRAAGDKVARELVFESIGLTGKRGPLIAVQQNFGLDSGLEELLISSQKVLSGETS